MTEETTNKNKAHTPVFIVSRIWPALPNFDDFSIKWW